MLGLEYLPLTLDGLFEMETFIHWVLERDRVAPWYYLSLWHWFYSLICGIVSFLGHTIAREPLSHEEEDGWLTHIYLYDGEEYQGKDRCQAFHH